jgi:hypothetical protein
MEAAMRKPEPVDEFAETEVLAYGEEQTDREKHALSLFAEYETELAGDAGKRRDPRPRR